MPIIQAHPKHLWFLTLSYCMIIVLANWFDLRIISIGGLATGAGALIFPLTFLLSDLITEVYGYKQARRAIWCGILFNLIFIIFGQIVIRLPDPDFLTSNAMFDHIFSFNHRIIFASIITLFCSEPLNAILISKIKIKMKGKYMGIRFILSTIIASGIDTIIFALLAFYGMFSNDNLFQFAISSWFIKTIIEIIGLPLSIRLAKKLKRIEKLDIYDNGTNFSMFTLDQQYSTEQNKFK